MLLYLHGFQSSPRSAKAWELGRYIDALGRSDLMVPMLPDRPMAAADVMCELVEKSSEPLCLVGSSLGGFYAQWLAEKYALPAILINPAVEAPTLLASRLGLHRNPYTGCEYRLTDLDLAVWRQMALPVTNPDRYWLMQQKGDEVLDYQAAVAHFQGAKITLEEGGSHRFDGFDVWLPQIISYADSQAVMPRSPV
ncbi:alpha/beta fold hydrolase [Leeia sp. TBRC 13508]|uniref:Alpha/beta fold hydrolase n=1 Tax=Leeia speluncae TaxID=2884804 RepID=A0ABS8D5H9_9NEIS|nr:YqiA/YcfP family alpha/beta fold hydrolase [Leeia speluncae]MCB6183427.1 alpha/beta fold hydrolase [Leeia speluncae]